MEQRSKDAAQKDAQINLIQEECAGDMAKRTLCLFEGCTNQTVKGGVCIKHGEKRSYAATKMHK